MPREAVGITIARSEATTISSLFDQYDIFALPNTIVIANSSSCLTPVKQSRKGSVLGFQPYEPHELYELNKLNKP
ncbi:hypothetical protein KAW18_08890 [candidate division WOR-3 bacterium]|nr:hypothetical protein [candidate division WOR-3 bacterium]MCK4527475.1 hypothetical protein [candidate division WOR-3 bacterium]